MAGEDAGRRGLILPVHSALPIAPPFHSSPEKQRMERQEDAERLKLAAALFISHGPSRSVRTLDDLSRSLQKPGKDRDGGSDVKTADKETEIDGRRSLEETT